MEAEKNPQIWRDALQRQLIRLQNMFSVFDTQLRKNNLYSTMLNDTTDRKLFDQLEDGYALSERFEVFRSAFNYQLASYDHVPSSHFLTAEETKQFSLLEVRLDRLKQACLMVDEAEDSQELDDCLLDKMRGGKPKGTAVHAKGTTHETHRWCPCCKHYAEPRNRKDGGRNNI